MRRIMRGIRNLIWMSITRARNSRRSNLKQRRTRRRKRRIKEILKILSRLTVKGTKSYLRRKKPRRKMTMSKLTRKVFNVKSK